MKIVTHLAISIGRGGKEKNFRLKIALGSFYNAFPCHASILFPFFLCKLFFSFLSFPFYVNAVFFFSLPPFFPALGKWLWLYVRKEIRRPEGGDPNIYICIQVYSPSRRTWTIFEFWGTIEILMSPLTGRLRGKFKLVVPEVLQINHISPSIPILAVQGLTLLVMVLRPYMVSPSMSTIDVSRILDPNCVSFTT